MNDRYRSLLTGLAALAALATLAAPAASSAQTTGAGSTFGDFRIRSSPEATDITLEVPSSAGDEDRTKRRPGLSAAGLPARVATPAPGEPALPPTVPTPTRPPEVLTEATPGPTPMATPKARPGALTVNEVHIFFPGASVPSPRMITVDDRIVQEARLFSEEGGVSMTIVARRPIYYVVSRTRSEIRVHVEPGSLLSAEPIAPVVKATVVPLTPKRGRPGARDDRGLGGSQLQTEQLMPKVTMPELKQGEGLTIDAENLTADEEKNEIVAKGHVTIARAGTLLTADEVRINRETQRATARGNVQFTDPQGSIEADSFTGDLEDETGVLENGNIYLSGNRLTISGQKIEKSYGQTYHIENGQFTTCRCGAGAPSWSIAGDSIDITLEGSGIARGAKFKVLDTPILYFPIVPFPAKRNRKSGLLAPLFGYSSKRGFQYMQPIYLAINKSADFTVSPDIETSARAGVILEYRYVLDQKSKGVLDFAYFNESLRNNPERDIVNNTVADPTIPKDRWALTASLRQELPLDIRAFADALAVSDDLYLREIPTFSFDPEYARTLRTSRFTSSRVGLYRFWEHATLIGQGVYYQDFNQPDDLTLQRLPQVEFLASNRFFDRKLKLGLNSEVVNFSRKQGFDGPRVDINPTAEVPFRWREYFNGNVAFQARETAYHLSNTDLLPPVSEAGGLQAPTAQQLDKNPTRELYQVGAMLTTQISRVFDLRSEYVQKLKHTVEPEVDYLYVPDVNQDDLPIYDFVDRINRRNLLTYGLTSRLLAKLEKAPQLDDRKRTDAVGDINSFTGFKPSPFDDESTRGGVSALGDPTLSGETPTEAVPETEEGVREAPAVPSETARLTAETGTPEAKAARLAEEKSAVSHVVEWAKVQVFQSYDLRDSLQTKRDDKLSDVDVHLVLTPRPFVSLLFDSTVDARAQEFTSNGIGFLLRDPRRREATGFLRPSSPASLGIRYRFVSDNKLQEVDGSLVVPLADSLSAFYQTRYDALDGTFLEKTGGLRLTSQCKCWIADVSVSDTINPQETQLRFQITLVGLGSIGRAR